MTDIRFYHMQQKKLEQALPEILAKALERQYRVVIKAGSQECLELLDKSLWAYQPESFLPHGSVKDGHEQEQPIWLTLEDENLNQANMLVLAGGASSENISGVSLCCEFIDGNDEEAVLAAREHWKVYKSGSHTLAYFQQDDDGKWHQKN